MTKRGEQASPAAKLAARHANPYSIAIKTPDGIFRSINECAQHYNLAPSTITHRCKLGDKQRKTKTKTALQDDWTGWEFWGKGVRPPCRRVLTPLGEFDSLKAAGRAHGVQAAVIRKKCIDGRPGYKFIEDQK